MQLVTLLLIKHTYPAFAPQSKVTHPEYGVTLSLEQVVIHAPTLTWSSLVMLSATMVYMLEFADCVYCNERSDVHPLQIELPKNVA